MTSPVIYTHKSKRSGMFRRSALAMSFVVVLLACTGSELTIPAVARLASTLGPDSACSSDAECPGSYVCGRMVELNDPAPVCMTKLQRFERSGVRIVRFEDGTFERPSTIQTKFDSTYTITPICEGGPTVAKATPNELRWEERAEDGMGPLALFEGQRTRDPNNPPTQEGAFPSSMIPTAEATRARDKLTYLGGYDHSLFDKPWTFLVSPQFIPGDQIKTYETHTLFAFSPNCEVFLQVTASELLLRGGCYPNHFVVTDIAITNRNEVLEVMIDPVNNKVRVTNLATGIVYNQRDDHMPAAGFQFSADGRLRVSGRYLGDFHHAFARISEPRSLYELCTTDGDCNNGLMCTAEGTCGTRPSPPWAKSVGALTPFDMNNALSITDSGFCDGAESEPTNCARQWVEAAKLSGKHLYAPNGTYVLPKHLPIFDGMHLRCEDPVYTVFQKESGTHYPHFGKFIPGGTDAETADTKFHDILIENCGFDMNGDDLNFATAINFANSEHVTIRNNRIFDSTGLRLTSMDHQRQYIVVIKVEDLLIEGNTLTHGGRIKAGMPGRRMIIRGNSLNFINDNAITVVGTTGNLWLDGTNWSEDILIQGNTIVDPTNTGIFFGSDGQGHGETVRVRRITIVDNDISGEIAGSCILGVLPESTSELFIARNTCNRSKFTSGYIDHFEHNSAIHLNNTDGIPREEQATQITLEDNFISSTETNIYDVSVIFFNRVQACVRWNTTENNHTGLWARLNATVWATGNDWGVGSQRTCKNSEIIEETTECYVPSWERSLPDSADEAARRGVAF